MDLKLHIGLTDYDELRVQPAGAGVLIEAVLPDAQIGLEFCNADALSLRDALNTLYPPDIITLTTPDEFESAAAAQRWDIFPKPVTPDLPDDYAPPAAGSVVRIGCSDKYYDTDIKTREELELFIQHLRAAADIAWPAPVTNKEESHG
jgi:hypothetical protein